MPPDDTDAESRLARLGADAVARATFPTSFRGYDPDHVRVFLEQVAEEIREARDREAVLRTELTAAEAKAEAALHPDEAQLTETLGEETVRVLLAAREAATEIRAKGEESVARLLREAQDDATRMKSEAETILAERTKEADEAAQKIRAAAEAAHATAQAEAEAAVVELLNAGEAAAEEARKDADRIRADASEEAETILEAARAEGRELVDEALLVRTRVLEDLSRKRKAARVQLERLQGGRDRLLASYDVVGRTLDEATNKLQDSLKAAKQVADAAARRAEAEPEATVEQLEAEVTAARDLGLPLVDDGEADAAFDGELPEGDMVPIEPSAEFEEVRVIEEAELEPEPEPEPTSAVEKGRAILGGLTEVIAVVDAVDGAGAVDDDEPVVIDDVVVEEVVIVEELDEAATEPTAVDVDDLFARIRAARATETAKAHEVLEARNPQEPATTTEPAPGPEDDTGTRSDGGRSGDNSKSANSDAAATADTFDDYVPAPLPPDDQALLERRDAATDSAEKKATRLVRRVLADEQNEVLDRLRRDVKAKLADLLPSKDEQATRYASAAASALSDAAAAGAAFYGGNGTIASVDALANEFGQSIAAPLRERVSASLREAAGDEEALADGVRSAYREWKAHRIGIQTRDSVIAAFNLGVYEATPAGTSQRWLVDDGGSPCPDAEDNSLAGLVVRGDPFPTGHCYPPAHPGCRCLLVPRPQ